MNGATLAALCFGCWIYAGACFFVGRRLNRKG